MPFPYTFPIVFSASDLIAVEAGWGVDNTILCIAVTSGDNGSGTELNNLLKNVYNSDAGAGTDALKVLSLKTGPDLKLRGHQGEVGISHKEVSL
jgi:hypothetical protein